VDRTDGIKIEHSLSALKVAKMKKTQPDKTEFRQSNLSQTDMDKIEPVMTGLRHAISAGHEIVKTCNLDWLSKGLRLAISASRDRVKTCNLGRP
jgi:hypothetical protein